MKKKLLAVLCIALAAAFVLAGCGAGSSGNSNAAASGNADAGTQKEEAKAENPYGLKDGTYKVKVTTDSSMFAVNETLNDEAVLTVKDGEMTVHMVLRSVNIVNLFPGTAEDAQKDGAVLLQPTSETVSYPDGTTEEAFAFDIPVTVLDTEFDCALIGKKGKWYDHKISVSSPIE